MSDVYMDDSVHLSNKACRLRYINVGPAKHEPGGAGGCQCPRGRCWYNEQQTRREHGLQAVRSQSWLTPEDLGATGDELRSLHAAAYANWVPFPDLLPLLRYEATHEREHLVRDGCCHRCDNLNDAMARLTDAQRTEVRG